MKCQPQIPPSRKKVESSTEDGIITKFYLKSNEYIIANFSKNSNVIILASIRVRVYAEVCIAH